MTPPLWQKLKRHWRASWWKWKRRVKKKKKACLKLSIQKTKIMASSPITSWHIDGETVTDFIFLGSKVTADGDCSHEIKRCLPLGRKWNEMKSLSCVWLFATLHCSLPGSSIHGTFQARVLEWVAIFLLQWIFPTQGSNLGLPHCRQTLYHLSHQGSLWPT